VAVIPSDHFVHDDTAFMSHVLALARFATRRPDRLVLVGARPDAGPSAQEWIEPGPPIGTIPDGPLFQIRRLGAGPAPEGQAGRAPDRLWNTGVFVAPVAVLLDLGRRRLGRLSDRLARIAPCLDSAEASTVAPAVPRSSRRICPGTCSLRRQPSRLPPRRPFAGLTGPRPSASSRPSRGRVAPAWLDALTPAASGGPRRASCPGRPPSGAPGKAVTPTATRASLAHHRRPPTAATTRAFLAYLRTGRRSTHNPPGRPSPSRVTSRTSRS
jgi:hypothetical protein